MWSYHQTSAPVTLATSSSSAAESKTSRRGNSTMVVRSSMSSTAETMGFPTSWTYLNSTATTSTATTTYASVRSTSVNEGTTSTNATAVGSASGETVQGGATSEQDVRTGSSHTAFTRTLTDSGITGAGTLNTTFHTSFVTQRTTVSSSASGTRLSRWTTTSSTIQMTTVTSSTLTVTTTTAAPGTTTTFVPQDATSVSSASTSITSSATSSWVDTLAYISSTSTLTTTATAQTTSMGTRSSSFLSSSTTTSGTSTITITVTSSSVDSVTSSATTNVAATTTSYATASFSLPAAVNTVIEMLTNEWGWTLTGTGSNRVESIGGSFTKTTFTGQGAGATFTLNTLTQTTTDSSTRTYPSTSYASSTTASTRSTTASSTYRVAQSDAVLPFSNTTKVATVSYTTTTGTTLTFSTSSTRTGTLIHFSDTGATVTSTFTDSVTTTFAGGTSISLITYTRPTTTAFFTAMNLTTLSDNGLGSTFSVTISRLLTAVTGTATRTFSRDSFSSPTPPTVAAATIGEGWQAGSVGRGEPIGTNLAPGTTSTISETALAWPTSVQMAVADSDAAVIAGVVPITLTNTRTTSRAGGYGWNTTIGSTFSQTSGIHRMTTCDNSTSGTVEKTWGAGANSTYSLAWGQALAAESVPWANSTSSSGGDSQFLSFAAFPST